MHGLKQAFSRTCLEEPPLFDDAGLLCYKTVSGWSSRDKGSAGADAPSKERSTMKKVPLAILLAALLVPVGFGAQNPKVLLRTELGDIALEVCLDRAPVTAANFLKYVDAGRYDGSVFHRTVTLDNQPNNTVKIEVVQGGQLPASSSFPAIPLERTSATGIKHFDGVVSMARSGPDTATSSFFICINDQPELDFGGRRNADGQGFAAFGRVVAGMDVVRKIQKQPADGQTLKPPVKILSARRID
jgi:peptidyl-prolyl cis-trans isomerase A (cyclophilin A)